jgi:hypothetical protein
MLKQGLAALIAKEDFIANENVGGTEFVAGNF